MISILLFGACGRMGNQILSNIHEPDIEYVAGVERQGHPSIGTKAGNVPIIADGSAYPEADVWLDFSIHEAVISHCRQAVKSHKPVIVAATGTGIDFEAEINKLADLIPILLAPNLSLGVAVLDRVVRDVAVLTKEVFDPAIFDLHHKAKKDSPSGTAKRLASSIEQSGSNPSVVSIRAGGAIGEHQVHFVAQNEELIFTHRAYSRKAFSDGILAAARFIIDQRPGIYSIADMLYNLITRK